MYVVDNQSPVLIYHFLQQERAFKIVIDDHINKSASKKATEKPLKIEKTRSPEEVESVRLEICQLLLTQYQGAASKPDVDKDLPLYSILSYVSLPLRLALTVLEAYPGATSVAKSLLGSMITTLLCRCSHTLSSAAVENRLGCSCSSCDCKRDGSYFWWYCPEGCDFDCCQTCAETSIITTTNMLPTTKSTSSSEGSADVQIGPHSLPLQLCIEREDAPTDLLSAVLSANPLAAQVKYLRKDKDGNQLAALPIHSAIERRKADAFLKSLIEAYPGCSSQLDGSNRTPIHIAIESRTAPDIIRSLLISDPIGATIADANGRLPLHLIFMGEDARLEILEPILSASPVAASVKDSDGKLPIHYAAKCTKTTADDIEVLLNAYPEGIRVFDADGRLPFHYAVANSAAVFVVESPHPYPDSKSTETIVAFPNATACTISFDKQSSTELDEDFVIFYKDETHTEYWGEGKYSGGRKGSNKNWPGVDGRPPLEVLAGKFVVYFFADSANHDWGFKLTAVGRGGLNAEQDSERVLKMLELLLERFPESPSVRTPSDDKLPILFAMESHASLPVFQRLLEVHPQYTNAIYGRNKSLIEIAIDRSLPLSFIKAIVAANPDILKSQKSEGRTPLHTSIYGSTNLDVLKFILSEYPQAASVNDSKGRTPYHAALTKPNSDAVILLLLSHYPEGASVRELKTNKLPLYYAMTLSSTEVVVKLIGAFPACAREKTNNNQLPLHTAAEKSLPAEVVQQLLDAYPDGARQLDKAGMIPLHYAVGIEQTRDLWLESAHPYADDMNEYTPIEVAGALSYLITFDEQSSMERDCDFITFYKDGRHTEYWGEQKYTGRNITKLSNNFPGINDRAPLEIPAGRFVVYFHSDNNGTDWGYKIHVAVRRLVETKDMVASRCSVISKLLEAYPAGASVKMRGGLLPFIVALDAEEPVSILEVLLAAYPSAARERNKAGHIALHDALERKYPTKLIYQCLSQVMPITLEGVPEPLSAHDH
jgi:ankyrin repeat protein